MNNKLYQVWNFLKKPAAKWAVLAVATCFLASCSLWNMTEELKVVDCPDFAILKAASEINGDLGEDKKPLWRAEITRIAGQCKASGEKTYMKLAVKFTATRNQTTINPGALQYFIAIVDQNQDVVAKQTEILDLVFADADFKEANLIETSEIELPKSDMRYEIFVGIEPVAQNVQKTE